MRTKEEIREKLLEIINNMSDNISDYRKNNLSLSKLGVAIKSLRWCLGEVEYIFPPVKKRYRKEEERINKKNHRKERI